MPSLTFVFDSKRVKLDFEPRTLISELIAQFCDRSGISELSNVLNAMYRGKPVPKSVPFNLSGISNNATLELINPYATSSNINLIARLPNPSSTAAITQSNTLMRSESTSTASLSSVASTVSNTSQSQGTVRVGIDLPTNLGFKQSRVVLNVPSITTLAEIIGMVEQQLSSLYPDNNELNNQNVLTRFDADGKALQLVLVYLQREFSNAEDFQLNLIKLGLKNGSSCLFRVNFRKFVEKFVTDDELKADIKLEKEVARPTIASTPSFIPKVDVCVI